MIKVNRGKEYTKIEIEGNLGDLLLESIDLVEHIGRQIEDNVENTHEVIFHWVDELIDAAYGKR